MLAAGRAARRLWTPPTRPFPALHGHLPVLTLHPRSAGVSPRYQDVLTAGLAILSCRSN